MSGSDDVSFISQLVDKLTLNNSVDTKRAYVTGVSPGAMMTYRLGCELSSKIAAIAPVEGNMADKSGNAENQTAIQPSLFQS
jgi:polyhydroxybutyrate depolymerase